MIAVSVGLLCALSGFSTLTLELTPRLSAPPQELPLKVQQVLGLYVPSSREDSPDSESGELQRLVGQSQAGAQAP